MCVINSVFASLQWNVTHLRELDPRQKCKRCVQFHKWDECVSLISSSGAISRCVQFPQKEEIAIEKSGWMNPNCSLSCCNFFLPFVCNFVLFQLLTCFTIEFMLHTTNYASRFTPLDLRYKNGNTVAISENWYQILCGPKSSPKRTRISCIYKAQNRWRAQKLCYFPPFMCFMQTFSKCTTISCISRDKTNGFSFSYEGVVEGRSRESTGKAFAAPVDRPPLSLTHHLTPQMCPLSTSQGGNLAIFGSKYKSFLPVVLRIRKM